MSPHSTSPLSYKQLPQENLIRLNNMLVPPSSPFLTVDLGVIVDNYRDAQASAAPAAVAPVVKADAYGLGCVEISLALYHAGGCRTFFVGSLVEGISLRDALPKDAALFVLNGPTPGEGAESLFLKHDLIPVLNTPEQVGLWEELGKKKAKTLPAALHVFSGMRRLSLGAADIPKVLAAKHVAVELLISHLSCADEPENPFNAHQLAQFKTIAEMFGCKKSIGATGALGLGPAYHFDMIRMGYGLYRAREGKPAVALSAKVLQVQSVQADERIGYGIPSPCKPGETRRIATVDLGYADGIPRAFSPKGYGWVRGVKVPVIGRVSMDLTTFDVTDVAGVAAGDLVELLGEHITPDDMAEAVGTIGYELLTSVGGGHRVTRTYLDPQQ